MVIVARVATWQAWQSKARGVATEWVRQKFWAGAVSCTGFFGGRGCLLYSLLGSEEENGGIMGGGLRCMCTLAAPGIRSKKESYEEAIRGLAAQQLQSTYLSLPLLPTLPNVSRKELLPPTHQQQQLFHLPGCQLFQTVHQSCSLSAELLTSASVCL